MRFSVVVPTYERREQLPRTLAALRRQSLGDFELIVVDDGSRDGIDAGLRRGSEGDFKLVEQENLGAAAARNAGAAIARGELLLFLDDDMEADPEMLAAHDRAHRRGAEIVLGDIPLDPGSPPGLLAKGVGVWAESRRRRLTEPGAEPGLEDLLTGQISISAADFARLGGFDEGLTRGGLFGGEDIDFGQRALKLGLRIEFEPDAISRQRYEIDPDTYLRRSYEVGRSEQELIVKHPEEAERLANGPRFHTRFTSWPLTPLVHAPAALSSPLRAAAVRLAESGRDGPRATKAFFAIRTLEHLRGARDTRRRLSHGTLKVLAYHSVSDRSDDPAIGRWTVPPALFAEHMRALADSGHNFVGLDEVEAALAGSRTLPPNAVLISFDDGYTDLLGAAREELRRHGAPGVVFAVSGESGGTNVWDREIGAPEMPLLDADGLLEAAGSGIEVGSHTVRHVPLREVSAEARAAELSESAAQIEALGLPRPRSLSYPYGDHDADVAAAARTAGYRVAFTIDTGVVGPEVDPMTVPRIEVLSLDSGRDLKLKVRVAGWPDRCRRRYLGLRGVAL